MDILQISVIISQSMTLLKKSKHHHHHLKQSTKTVPISYQRRELSFRLLLERQPSYPQNLFSGLKSCDLQLAIFSRCGIHPNTPVLAYWLDKLTCCTVLHKLFASTLIWENFQINVQLHFSPFQQLFSMILRTKSTFPRLFQDGTK